MRRGQAALTILRSYRISAAKERITRSAIEALRKLLRRYDLAASTDAVQLGIEATSGKPVDFLIPTPGVTDGLHALIGLGAKISTRGTAPAAGDGEDYPRVLRAYMIVPARRVSSVPLQITASTQVIAPGLIGTPGIRAPSLLMFVNDLKVRAIAILTENTGVRDAFPRVHIAEPAVRDRTAGFAAFPHIRGGVDIERVDPQEREGFLREAESMKGVPAGQGQLLALFRNVPVELIAKAHYSEEKNLLLYTLDGVRECARTRVHDLGIVRDTAAAKTHMVVHRRQFKSVQIA